MKSPTGKWVFNKIGIKSVSWECNYDEEYLEEFDKETFLDAHFLLALLPWNRLDPKIAGDKSRTVNFTDKSKSPQNKMIWEYLLPLKEGLTDWVKADP